MCNYFDFTVNNQSNGFYIYMGGRNSGKTIYTMPYFMEYLFGGKCEYHYDPQTMTHHYLIENDDIGFMDMTVTNECFIYEKVEVRIPRMCEEYLAYMEYKYRDYKRFSWY
jgi:hypothetical protein